MSAATYHPALTSTRNNRRYPSPPMLPHMAPSSVTRVQRSRPRSSNSNIFGWQPPPGASHSSTGPHGDIPIPFARNGRAHPYARPRASTYSAAGPSYGNASMFTVGPATNYRAPSPTYGLPSPLGPNHASFLGSTGHPGQAHRLSANRTPLPALLGGPLHGNTAVLDLGIGALSSDPYADSPFGRPNPCPDAVSPSFMTMPTMPILPMHIDPPQADAIHSLFGHSSLQHDAGLLYPPPTPRTAQYPFTAPTQEHTPESQGHFPPSHTTFTHPHPPSSGLAHVIVRSSPPSPSLGVTSFNVTRVRSNSATLVGADEDIGTMRSPPSLSGSDSSPPGSLYSVPSSPSQPQGSFGSGGADIIRQGFELEPAPPTGDPLSDFWGAHTAEANKAARGKSAALPARQRPRGAIRS